MADDETTDLSYDQPGGRGSHSGSGGRVENKNTEVLCRRRVCRECMSISEAFFKYDMNCDHSVIFKISVVFFLHNSGNIF